MNRQAENAIARDDLEAFLAGTREMMTAAFEATPLAGIVSDAGTLLGQGKMLRSRLVYRLGRPNEAPRELLLRAAAAVEMIHAASLLHDDVIDGGFLRRGAPAFWVDRGIPGAILLGDLILFRALSLIAEADGGRLTRRLIELTGKVCEAESEQELILRGTDPTWETCVGIARRKTGSLFAFAGYACGGDDAALSEALQEAGFGVGTAYQIADDILDASGLEEESGKTLGTDETRRKTTAARLDPAERDRPAAFIDGACRAALDGLAPWPAVQTALRDYLKEDLGPLLERYLHCLSSSD